MFWNWKKNKRREDYLLKNKKKYDEKILYLCEKRKLISDCVNMYKLVYEINNLKHISKSKIKSISIFNEDCDFTEGKRMGVMKSRTIKYIDKKIAVLSCKKFGIFNKNNN